MPGTTPDTRLVIYPLAVAGRLGVGREEARRLMRTGAIRSQRKGGGDRRETWVTCEAWLAEFEARDAGGPNGERTGDPSAAELLGQARRLLEVAAELLARAEKTVRPGR